MSISIAKDGVKVMRAYFACLLLLVVLVAGCDKNQQPPAAPNPKDLLLNHARSIIVDPNNWKKGTEAFVAFSEIAESLGWADKQEVRDFKASSMDLIIFSTTWIDRLDQEERRKASEGWSTILTSFESKIPGAIGAASVQIDQQSAGRQAEGALKSSSSKLSAAEAEKFGKIFGRAVDAYTKLYALSK